MSTMPMNNGDAIQRQHQESCLEGTVRWFALDYDVRLPYSCFSLQ